jgi:hypothetical protein
MSDQPFLCRDPAEHPAVALWSKAVMDAIDRQMPPAIIFYELIQESRPLQGEESHLAALQECERKLAQARELLEVHEYACRCAYCDEILLKEDLREHAMTACKEHPLRQAEADLSAVRAELAEAHAELVREREEAFEDCESLRVNVAALLQRSEKAEADLAAAQAELAEPEHEHAALNSEMLALIRQIADDNGASAVPFLDDAVLVCINTQRKRAEIAEATIEQQRQLLRQFGAEDREAGKLRSDLAAARKRIEELETENTPAWEDDDEVKRLRAELAAANDVVEAQRLTIQRVREELTKAAEGLDDHGTGDPIYALVQTIERLKDERDDAEQRARDRDDAARDNLRAFHREKRGRKASEARATNAEQEAQEWNAAAEQQAELLSTHDQDMADLRAEMRDWMQRATNAEQERDNAWASIEREKQAQTSAEWEARAETAERERDYQRDQMNDWRAMAIRAANHGERLEHALQDLMDTCAATPMHEGYEAFDDAFKAAKASLAASPPAQLPERNVERTLIEQICRDLNDAHNEILRLQGCASESLARYDWPEWSSPANSIRAAERLLGRKLAKTDIWTMYPAAETERRDADALFERMIASGELSEEKLRESFDRFIARRVVTDPATGEVSLAAEAAQSTTDYPLGRCQGKHSGTGAQCLLPYDHGGTCSFRSDIAPKPSAEPAPESAQPATRTCPWCAATRPTVGPCHSCTVAWLKGERIDPEPPVEPEPLWCPSCGSTDVDNVRYGLRVICMTCDHEWKTIDAYERKRASKPELLDWAKNHARVLRESGCSPEEEHELRRHMIDPAAPKPEPPAASIWDLAAKAQAEVDAWPKSKRRAADEALVSQPVEPRTLTLDETIAGAEPVWTEAEIAEAKARARELAPMWGVAEPELPDYVRAAGYQIRLAVSPLLPNSWIATSDDWTSGQAKPKATAIADCIAHYEANNDPPGYSTKLDGVSTWYWESDDYAGDYEATFAIARADAWRHYHAARAQEDNSEVHERENNPPDYEIAIDDARGCWEWHYPDVGMPHVVRTDFASVEEARAAAWKHYHAAKAQERRLSDRMYAETERKLAEKHAYAARQDDVHPPDRDPEGKQLGQDQPCAPNNPPAPGAGPTPEPERAAKRRRRAAREGFLTGGFILPTPIEQKPGWDFVTRGELAKHLDMVVKAFGDEAPTTADMFAYFAALVRAEGRRIEKGSKS